MRSRRDLVAILLLCGVVTLLWGDVLFLGQNLFERDLFSYHYPMKKIVRDLVLQGEFPVWNPTLSGGQPVAANPAWEVFYPPQWLTLLPSYRFGFMLHVIIHFLIAAIGMYLLLRSLDCGEAAAGIGALLFVLGGPLMSLTNLLPFLFSVAWAPWIFLFARRALLERQRRDVALAALFGGMQALVGEPTTLMQTWGFVVAYAGWLAWNGRTRKGLLQVAAVVAIVLAGTLCVAAVQLVPAVDFVGDTVRSRGWPLEGLTRWSLPLVRPFEMVVPQYFRQLRGPTGESRLLTLYRGELPYLGDLYLGLLPVALALSMLSWRRRGTVAAAAVAVVAYLIAIGKHAPFFAWLHAAGLFRSIRYPEKFVLVATVILVVLASLALERLLAGDGSVIRRTRNVALIWTVVVFFAWLGASPVTPPAPATVFDAAIYGFDPPSARIVWLHNLLRGLALSALLIAFERLPRRRQALVWVFAAFVVADLWYLRAELAPRAPAEFAKEPALAASIPEPRAASRLFHAADWNWYDGRPLSEAWMTSPQQHWLFRNGLFPRSAAAWGIPSALEEDIDETHLLNTSELTEAMHAIRGLRPGRWIEIFAGMSNVGWSTEFVSPAAPVVDPPSAQPVRVVRVGPYPRYYLAETVRPVEGRPEFVQELATRDWPAGVAFVQGAAAMDPARGQVKVIEERPASVRLEVSAGGPTFLVASITHHRYWSASVDGRPAKLIPTNLAYQGLALDGGRHIVEMRYRNPWIFPSALVSLSALLAIAAAALIRRKA